MAEKPSEKPATPDAAANGAAASAKAAGGGKGAMMPLIATIVLMPALAFVMTNYVIVPKLEKAIGKGSSGAPAAKASGGGHGSAPAAAGGHGEAAAKSGGGHGGAPAAGDKHEVMLNKMINNVSGTMGTRYLMTSVTLVGADAEITTKVEEHKAQLLDVAAGTLSAKTIADLEKPGARNQIRTELLSVFNNVLGENTVRELFITELAIQ